MEENSDPEKVIDSSFFLCYLMPDEYDASVQRIFNEFKSEKIRLFSAPILPFEVINGIFAAIISKRINNELALLLAKEFLKLPIKLKKIDYLEVLKISQKYKLTVYDASYVWLSKKENIPLLTLDRKMQKLAK